MSPKSLVADAELYCHRGCAHHSQAQELASSKSIAVLEGTVISLRAPGLLFSSGGRDQQEGLLCTTASDPEKACPQMKSQEGLSNRDPGLLKNQGK